MAKNHQPTVALNTAQLGGGIQEHVYIDYTCSTLWGWWLQFICIFVHAVLMDQSIKNKIYQLCCMQYALDALHACMYCNNVYPEWRGQLIYETHSASPGTSLQGKARLQVLQDAWNQCEGNWSRSDLYLRLTNRTTHSQKGARVWMTHSQLTKKYESASIADQIVNAKLQDEELSRTHVKPHPDMPNNQAGSLIKALVVHHNWTDLHAGSLGILVSWHALVPKLCH